MQTDIMYGFWGFQFEQYFEKIFLRLFFPTMDTLICHMWTSTHIKLFVACHMIWGHLVAYSGLRKPQRRARIEISYQSLRTVSDEVSHSVLPVPKS
jgi:hypothetical protein